MFTLLFHISVWSLFYIFVWDEWWLIYIWVNKFSKITSYFLVKPAVPFLHLWRPTNKVKTIDSHALALFFFQISRHRRHFVGLKLIRPFLFNILFGDSKFILLHIKEEYLLSISEIKNNKKQNLCAITFFLSKQFCSTRRKRQKLRYIYYIYTWITPCNKGKKKEGKIEREMTKSENLIINNNPIASISRQTFLV